MERIAGDVLPGLRQQDLYVLVNLAPKD